MANMTSGIVVNKTFGRWTVLHQDKLHYWWCRCTCGKERAVDGVSLVKGRSLSCGCLAIERARKANTHHGAALNGRTDRLYNIWKHMRRRCDNVHDEAYRYYGGRGITVCTEWNNSYIAFRQWAVANGYQDNLTIERINGDGHYTPTNCVWASQRAQNRNTSRNIYITAFGQTKLLIEWMRDSRCQISYVNIQTRIAKGWTPEAAISTPPANTNNKRKEI